MENGKEIVYNIGEVSRIMQRFLIPLTLLVFLPYMILSPKIDFLDLLADGIRLILDGFVWKGIYQIFIYPWLSLVRTFNYFGWALVSLIPGIVLHELIHAVAAIILNKFSFRSVKFGFNTEYFAPYTHFKKPMAFWKYRIVLVSPLILTGILPLLAGWIYFNPEFLFFALFFIAGAMGDVFVLYQTRRYDRYQLVKDHPENLGIILYS